MLSVFVIIDDAESIGADSQRTNNADIGKKWQSHYSPKYTIIMLTFFATLCTEKTNCPLFHVGCLCHY
jgi:hypothetical protein